MLKKYIYKFISCKDYLTNHFFTLLRAYIFNKNLFFKKGIFSQKTIFLTQGKIEIGDNFSIGFKYGGGFNGRFCELQTREKDSLIRIGKNLATNNGIFICARKEIIIGNNVLIGSNVNIMDHNGHGIQPSKRRITHGTPFPIFIGDNVWIGNFAQILPGTSIGENSIVGAGAVVKGIFPANCIIEGNPGKITKYIEIKKGTHL